jgi:hypothetical protein
MDACFKLEIGMEIYREKINPKTTAAITDTIILESVTREELLIAASTS